MIGVNLIIIIEMKKEKKSKLKMTTLKNIWAINSFIFFSNK